MKKLNLKNKNKRRDQNQSFTACIVLRILKIPVLDGLGSTAGGLTDPPEDRLEGELPG